jgi:hypothetical protein
MPAPAGRQIDLNSLFREPQDLKTLRNADQIDSAGSVRGKQALLGGGCQLFKERWITVKRMPLNTEADGS